MIVATSSSAFTATVGTAIPNLVGTIAAMITDTDGNIIVAASTANILEILDAANDPTGEYVASRVAPGPLGSYLFVWSTDGTFDPATVAEEDMTVVQGAVTPVLPPIPTPAGPGPVAGPCEAWLTVDQLADFCKVDVDSSTTVFLEEATVSASQILFEMSGRQFSGLCSQTVRPCLQPCGAWTLAGWPSQWYGFGWNGLDFGAGGWGWWGQNGEGLCGCRALAQVKLPGYPAVEIVEVKINGDILPADDVDGDPNYRLDEWQLLTRMAKPGPPAQPRFWPSCQNLDLDDTESGTFSVRYQFGVAPPMPGVLAAQELGCEVYKALNGEECRLPVGASQVNRQGINITRGLLVNWALAQSSRGGAHPRSWSTGLPLTDAFLSAYNPTGRRGRSRIFSPDLQQYARQVGT